MTYLDHLRASERRRRLAAVRARRAELGLYNPCGVCGNRLTLIDDKPTCSTCGAVMVPNDEPAQDEAVRVVDSSST